AGLRVARGDRPGHSRPGWHDLFHCEKAHGRNVPSPGDHDAARSNLGPARRAPSMIRIVLVNAVAAVLLVASVRGQSRPRARDLGIEPGVYPPGPVNAITDVEGVRVGHVTIVDGDTVRTGVTATLPHDGNVFQDKVAGAVFVGN